MLSQLTVAWPALAALPALTDSDLQRLGQRIYANECNQRFECLASWNAGEDFPSLGIGHFIWYQQGQEEVFEETFPALLDYLQQRAVPLPEWLSAAGEADSPWTSREQFLAASESEKMGQLRQFLYDSRAWQSAFIAERLQSSLPQLLAAVPTEQRPELRRRFMSLANTAPPYGLYALIDYVH